VGAQFAAPPTRARRTAHSELMKVYDGAPGAEITVEPLEAR
jgi:hypothetical protein